VTWGTFWPSRLTGMACSWQEGECRSLARHVPAMPMLCR